MPRPLRAPKSPISYSIPDAAEATGYSETTVKTAIKNGELTPRYATPAKPVLLHDDLVEWIASRPTERQ